MLDFLFRNSLSGNGIIHLIKLNIDSNIAFWDWIAGENRIASDFTRFYRIAKGVYL